MAWEIRKGRRYYYRTRRTPTGFKREYVGTGEAAELAAKLDAEAADQRALARAERRRSLEELIELVALFDQLDRDLTDHITALMTASGFHRHRGDWRKKTVANPNTPQPATNAPAATDPVPLHKLSRVELIDRAEKGDETTRPQIRKLVNEPGAADVYGGNVAREALNTAVFVLSRKDIVTQEATMAKLVQLRDELAGPNASLVERMVVDRVLAMWLHLHHLEHEAALEGEHELDRAAHFQRAITAAQNRYFAAIRELAKVRRRAVRPVEVSATNTPEG